MLLEIIFKIFLFYSFTANASVNIGFHPLKTDPSAIKRLFESQKNEDKNVEILHHKIANDMVIIFRNLEILGNAMDKYEPALEKLGDEKQEKKETIDEKVLLLSSNKAAKSEIAKLTTKINSFKLKQDQKREELNEENFTDKSDLEDKIEELKDESIKLKDQLKENKAEYKFATKSNENMASEIKTAKALSIKDISVKLATQKQEIQKFENKREADKAAKESKYTSVEEAQLKEKLVNENLSQLKKETEELSKKSRLMNDTSFNTLIIKNQNVINEIIKFLKLKERDLIALIPSLTNPLDDIKFTSEQLNAIVSSDESNLKNAMNSVKEKDVLISNSIKATEKMRKDISNKKSDEIDANRSLEKFSKENKDVLAELYAKIHVTVQRIIVEIEESRKLENEIKPIENAVFMRETLLMSGYSVISVLWYLYLIFG